MRGRNRGKVMALHLAIIAFLFVLQFILPAYHHGSVSRIMLFATYAMGFNLLFGYTGLLSLGHAMFFGAGMYATGLSVYYFGFGPYGALGLGIAISIAVSLAVGAVALRTAGMSFLIVTLMLSQASWLSVLYFKEITGGDYGLIISPRLSALNIGWAEVSLNNADVRYNIALLLFSLALMGSVALMRSPIGRILVAIRENEARTSMLGYNTFRYKLLALVLSGGLAGISGSVYTLLFGHVGSTFVEISQSINAILWTLLGGAGTILGPLVGTAVMYYLVDVSSGLTRGFMFVVGAILVLLVLWLRAGIVGTIRSRWLPWLP